MMNGGGKSGSCIVPAKSVNAASHRGPWSHGEPYPGTKGETPETAKGEPKASRSGGVGDGESVEGRQLAKGNTVEQHASRTQSLAGANSALDRVREAARKDRNAKFTALRCCTMSMSNAYERLSSSSSGRRPRGWTA